MYTKVVASKIATNLGVHVAVVNGNHPRRIIDILQYTAKNRVDVATSNNEPDVLPPTSGLPDALETQDCGGNLSNESKPEAGLSKQGGGSCDDIISDENSEDAGAFEKNLQTKIRGGVTPNKVSDASEGCHFIAQNDQKHTRPFSQHHKHHPRNTERMQHNQQRELPERVSEGGQLKSDVWKRSEFSFRLPRKDTFKEPPFIGMMMQKSVWSGCGFVSAGLRTY